MMAPLMLVLSLAAPPAGEYYSGDGLGKNWTVRVTGGGRFDFEWHGCLGLYDSNKGSFVVDGPWVTLNPEKPRANGFGRQLPLKWLYLGWGDRHYLIADDELGDFIRAINDQSEPRTRIHGRFLLRMGEWELPAVGVPPLPPEWTALLRPRPISAEVVSVDGSGTATLDAGTSAGLAVGLPLTVMSPKKGRAARVAWGTVVDATPSSARLRITMGDRVKPGDVASTNPY